MIRLSSEYEKDAAIRDVWKGTLEKFTQKLEDKKTATYDKDYYQNIYANCLYIHKD